VSLKPKPLFLLVKQMTNIYLGKNSCYARKEGIYVKPIAHPGIDTVTEAAGILYLVLRDYHRHKTYAHVKCREIYMSKDLFVKRATYVIALSKKHGASKREQRIIERLVEYVLRRKKLPKKFKPVVRRALARRRRK